MADHRLAFDAPNTPRRKANKQVDQLYAKQIRRKIKTDRLPSSENDISIEAYSSFAAHLRKSTRIAALCGAGLSAASGIPTFRGPGGFWRQYNAADLATPETFAENPAMVWQFFDSRRIQALQARPNRGHYALAELGRHRPGFLAITQNIDGLSERAGHPEENLQRVHGTLHKAKCSNRSCNFKRDLEATEPTAPDPGQLHNAEAPDSTASQHERAMASLPRCPQCGALLRPDVVWFGESLDMNHVERIHAWFDAAPTVDLMVVIGTEAVVFPAAAYIHAARVQGARIAVFNTNPPDEAAQENPITQLRKGVDWFFEGSAAETVPDLLKEVIGVVHDTSARQ